MAVASGAPAAPGRALVLTKEFGRGIGGSEFGCEKPPHRAR